MKEILPLGNIANIIFFIYLLEKQSFASELGVYLLMSVGNYQVRKKNFIFIFHLENRLWNWT